MPRLTAAQRERLIPILVDAFPSRAQMVAILFASLDVSFDALAHTENYATDLAVLLEAAQTDGWTRRLLAAFQKANLTHPPGNQALIAFLEPFDLSPAALAREPQQIPLHYRRRAAEKTYTPPPLPATDKLPEPAWRDELPPGFTLPLLRNDFFTGREADLLALAQGLLYDPQPSAVIAHGLGGTGKTQLAAEFCYRYGPFFQGMHWIQVNPQSAKPDEDIKQGIVSCGEAMRLQPWPDDPEGKRQRTLQAWAEDPPRLLVLDNLEEAGVLQRWLGELRGCRVLVTARRGVWPKGKRLRPHPLGQLSPEECRELLRKLCPRLEAEPDQDLDDLSGRLGHLTLALVLASFYLAERTDLTLSGYLDALNSSPVFADPAFQEWVAASDIDHPTDLAATFRLSWDALADPNPENELARSAFLACGWLAPNWPVPVDILAGAVLEEGINSAPLFKALRRLYELGLLAESPAGPVTHPLLAEFGRLLCTSLPAESVFEMVTQAAIQQANRANNTGIPANFTPLRPHLEQLLAHLQGAPTGAAASLMNELGFYLKMVGEYRAARPYYEGALAIYRETLGEAHPDTATSLNNLGSLLQDLGDLEGARPYYEQALAIRLETLGDMHQDTAQSLNNLGMLLLAMGDLEAAQPYLEQALAIDKEILGEKHTDTATSLNNLGILLQTMGNLDEARPYFEQALAIYRESLGDKHPDTAQSLNNLGSLLYAEGDLAGARPYYEEALAIRRETLGEVHPDTAQSLNNLGNLRYAMGNLEEARRYFEQALAIDKEVLGENHPDYAMDLNNMGMLMQATGDLAGARAHYEQSLAIRMAVLGAKHTDTAASFNNLGGLLYAEGDLLAALPFYEQALLIYRVALGDRHPDTAYTWINLIMVLAQSGENKAALAEVEIVMSIAKDGELPDWHPFIRFLETLSAQREQDFEPDDL